MNILVHVAILCLIFWRPASLFSKGLHHFVFSPAVYEGSNFSSPWQHFLLPLFLMIKEVVKWYFMMVLICISLRANSVDNFLCVPIGYLYIFFVQIAIWIFYPFSIELSFYYWIIQILYSFWILDPCSIHDLQIFSLIFSVTFTFLITSF